MADVELAIVGAGPAGCAAAVAARSAGVQDIALIDKAGFPRDKACGDGLGPGVVRVLKDLNLEHLLAGRSPIARLAVSSPSRRTVSGPLPFVGGQVPVGYVIPRKTFDDLLFRAALERGVGDFSGWALETASFDDAGEWALTLEQGGATKMLTTRYLIGADGARSKVRRLLGQTFNDPAHTGTAVRVYAASSTPLGKELRLDFMQRLLPAYGWAFPIDDTTANIGVGIDIARYQERHRHLHALLEDYEALVPGLTADLATRQTFILPYGSQLPRLAFPDQQAALVGDAGSMINPLTGEGIYYGMWAGAEAGRRVASAIASSSPYKLAAYETNFRAKFADHFRTNQVMKDRVAHPAWCDLVIGACARNKTVLAELIDLMMGDRKHLSLALLGKIAIGGLP